MLKNPALKGKWEWGHLFTYADVIHYWNVWPPSKFFSASQEDQAFAIVYYESKTGMEAWDAHVQNVKHQSEMSNMRGSEE